MRFYLFIILVVVATLAVSAKSSKSSSSSDTSSSDDTSSSSKPEIDCSEESCPIADVPEKDMVCGEGSFDAVNHVVEARIVEEISSTNSTKEYIIEILRVIRSSGSHHSHNSGILPVTVARLKISTRVTADDCSILPGFTYILFVEKAKFDKCGKLTLKYTNEEECFVWFRQDIIGTGLTDQVIALAATCTC